MAETAAMAASRSLPSLTTASRVQVFARVRPSLATEDAIMAVMSDDATGVVRVRNDADAVERIIGGGSDAAGLATSEGASNHSDVKEFTFDGVFPEHSSQREVFIKVGLPVLRECLKGFNGTVLAYGQTGSGKTHSLLHQTQRGEEAGLLPRLIASLFLQMAQDSANVYSVEAAAVQVYNEQIDDLLNSGHQMGSGHNLGIRDNGLIPGLTWIACTRPEQMMEAFSNARANVVYAETKMNKASSRSHAVFQIRISKRQRASAGKTSVAQSMECSYARLNIVDLAGSERVKKSGAEGVRFQEATSINRSLLAFGNVVSALASKKAHVPFRDSKLTRLLDGSVGGNCKTALLVCASPVMDNASETLHAFEFASRAMRVEVDAKVNTHMVEVSAKQLMADLSSDAEQLGGAPYWAELEQLRRKSKEAADNAKSEAEQRKKAMAEAKKMQQIADVAEQQGRKWQQEAVSLRKSQQEAQDDVDRLRESVIHAERLAQEWKENASKKANEAEELKAAVAKAEKSAQEWKAAAESRVMEVAQAKEEVKAAKEEVHSNVLNTRQREELTQLRLEVASTTKKSEARVAAAEKRAVEAEAQVNAKCTEASGLQSLAEQAQASATQAAEQLSAKEAEIATFTDRLQLAEAASAQAIASLEEHKLRSEDQLASEKRKASEEATLLRLQLEEAKTHCRVLEGEVAARVLELRERDRILDEAKESIAVARSEVTIREEELRAEFAAELEAVRLVAKAELEALRLQVLENQASAEANLEEKAQRHAAEVLELKTQFAKDQQAFADECVRIEEAHAQAMEAQRGEFLQQWEASKQDFEARLAEVSSASEAQIEDLQARLEAERDRFDSTEKQMRDQNQAALREAWEQGNSQQRRLAAAFKAARAVSHAKEMDVRGDYAKLAERFASRESREDDVREIAKQRRALEERERALKARDTEVRGLCLELQNRDDTDRIFSEPEMRRNRRSAGIIPALPGKKLNENCLPFPIRCTRLNQTTPAPSRPGSATSVKASSTTPMVHVA